MPQFIDMTPTWEQTLSMHWHMLQQVSKPSGSGREGERRYNTISRNFICEMTRMARAADRWNDYCQSVAIESGAAEQAEAARINTFLDPERGNLPPEGELA
jgi:hypothetical protein